MFRTGELHLQIAETLVNQAVLSERATKHAALNSLIGILDSKLATANERETHFLQLELAQAIGDLRSLVSEWKIESKLVQDRP